MKICFHVQGQCGETADGEGGEGGEARDQPPSESEVPSKDTEGEREVEEDERKEGAEESVLPPEKGQGSVHWCSHNGHRYTQPRKYLLTLYHFHRSV